MDATIIIGANYGDEGKGLATDYFTHKYVNKGNRVLNVLHNGGAQRAHTVETSDGIRHVFHHVGSGSLAGADTYITGEFIVNPILLKTELEELRKLKCTPKVYIDDMMRISTPFDMMANQIKEDLRSPSEKLGTCGMGIWETCCRNTAVRFIVQDLLIAINQKNGVDYLRSKLIQIRDYYKKWRLSDISIPDEWSSIFFNDIIIENFIDDLYWMIMDKQIYYPPSFYINTTQQLWAPFKQYDHIIFENGQGLLLDTEIYDGAEFNTPSHTTRYNPAKIISMWHNKHGIIFDTCHSIYVSRTYVTRHGNGKLKNELNVSYLENRVRIFDKTNIPNQWQGSLRYAQHGWFYSDDPNESLFKRLSIDKNAKVWNTQSIKYWSSSIFMTHVDELNLPNYFEMIVEGRKNEDGEMCIEAPCKGVIYLSYGPTRENVKEFSKYSDIY